MLNLEALSNDTNFWLFAPFRLCSRCTTDTWLCVGQSCASCRAKATRAGIRSTEFIWCQTCWKARAWSPTSTETTECTHPGCRWRVDEGNTGPSKATSPVVEAQVELRGCGLNILELLPFEWGMLARGRAVSNYILHVGHPTARRCIGKWTCMFCSTFHCFCKLEVMLPNICEFGNKFVSWAPWMPSCDWIKWYFAHRIKELPDIVRLSEPWLFHLFLSAVDAKLYPCCFIHIIEEHIARLSKPWLFLSCASTTFSVDLQRVSQLVPAKLLLLHKWNICILKALRCACACRCKCSSGDSRFRSAPASKRCTFKTPRRSALR